MKNIISIIYVLLILVLGSMPVLAQSGSLFDYQVRPLEDNIYEFTMSINNADQIKLIEIGFLDDPEAQYPEETFNATLNLKMDNHFYLFINDAESKVNPESFVFSIQRLIVPDEPIIDSGIKSVYIKVFNKDFLELDAYQQIINY